jgi:YD repeat-containing protein
MNRTCWSAVAACLLVFASLAAALQTNGPVQYAYDELGRLVAVFDANGNAAVYGYDAVGNILSIARYTSTQVTVLSFTPAHGNVGSSVTIYGTGFSATPSQNTVQFNGVAAIVASSTANQLVVTVPTGATTGPLTVTTPAGTAASSSSFTVSSGGPPTITGFTPAIATPGTAVTITGTNFDASPRNDLLRFNVAPTLPTAANAGSISTSVPSAGTSGHITVTTPAGTAVSSQDFFVPFNIYYTAADVLYTGRTTIGGTATVTLNAPSKIGILLFDANAGQHVIPQWTSTIPGCTVALYAPNGTQLSAAPCSGTSSGTNGSIDNTLLPASGTYTIGVQDNYSTGSITLNLTDVSDVTGTIAIDGPPVTIATTKAGQDARLFFSATAGQRVVVRVTNVSSAQSATLSLLGVTGEPVSTLSTCICPGSQVIFMDTVPLVATGGYSLWVRHGGVFVGSQTLQLSSVPPDFTAPITIGGPAIGVPATGNTVVGQNGILPFTAAAGQRVSVSTSSGTYSSCTLSIRDSNWSTLSSGSCAGTTGFADTATLSAAGTYWVLVDPLGMDTGATMVQLNDDSDVTGTISIDGPSVTTTTTHSGQDARLTFSGAGGQRIFLRVTGVTNASATVLFLKPDGTQLTAAVGINNAPGQVFFIDTQTLPITGTYTLWVEHSGSNVGSETLQLSSVPADFTAPITMGGSAVRVPATGNTVLGQNASLTFTATAGQKLDVNLSNATYTPYSACLATLMDPSGNALTSGYCGSGATSPIFVTATSTGTYTIFIDPLGTAVGTATFSLTSSSDVTGTIAIDGSPVTTTTTIPGQDARLAFSGTAGQRVVLQVTGVTNPSASVVLLRPDNSSQISLPIYAGQASFLDTQTLATTGTYTLWVQHSGSNVGSETLQLNSVPADFTSPITVGGSAVRVPATGNTAIGQNASLTFTGTAGQRVSVSTSSGTYSSCTVSVKDSSGANLSSGSCAGATGYADTTTLTTNGTYTVFVDPQGTATGTTTALLNDDSDVTGTISIDGASVTTTTTRAGQDARLTFSGTAGQRVVLRVTNVTNPSATVNLVRPDGTTQFSTSINNNPAGQVFFVDTFTLTTAGTYTLWIQHSLSNIGSETLQLNSVPADFTAPISISGPAVRVPATGNTALGQNASLTFTATAGQKVSVSTSNGTYASSSCQVSVRDSNSNVLSFASCSGATSYLDTTTLNTAGNYSVFVNPLGTATGTTTVLLNDDSDVTGAITVDGPPVTATTTTGQDARYTFSATAGQRVVLQVTSVTNPAATVNLLKPDGSTQASLSITPGQTYFMDTQTLSAAGTYTLWVKHTLSYAGSETLQLNSVPADFTGTLTINGGGLRVPDTGNTALGQNATLTFSATAGQSLKINFSNSTYTQYGCYLALKNPSGGFVTANYCGSGATSPISATAATAGTYTILVDPQTTSTGTVTISVTSP